MARGFQMRLITIILLIATFIITHELTHAEIFRLHGCENINFGISQLGVYTHAEQCAKDPTLAQSINEIVGYTIAPLLILIVFIISDK